MRSGSSSGTSDFFDPALDFDVCAAPLPWLCPSRAGPRFLPLGSSSTSSLRVAFFVDLVDGGSVTPTPGDGLLDALAEGDVVDEVGTLATRRKRS